MTEKILRGQEGINAAEFLKKVARAETDLAAYKGEFQRHLVLSRSYDKLKDKAS